MTQLLDNKGDRKVGSALEKNIDVNARLSVISGLFSIYGYAALQNQLSEIDSLRLLIPANNSGLILSNDKQPLEIASIAGDYGDRRFRNTLNLTQVARECSEWLKQKANIKAIALPVPQNLFHIHNSNGNSVAIHGSSSFTSSGLGFSPSHGYEMNTLFTTPSETESLLEWFDAIWKNPDVTQDLKPFVLSQLESIFSTKSPKLIYFLTLYNVFRELLGELKEDEII
jgi:hypothetical protein